MKISLRELYVNIAGSTRVNISPRDENRGRYSRNRLCSVFSHMNSGCFSYYWDNEFACIPLRLKSSEGILM